MSTEHMPERPVVQAQKEPRQVRLPRFITNGQDVGLGDVAKKVTALVGIRPCGLCAERARKLNNWVVFSAQPPTNTKE